MMLPSPPATLHQQQPALSLRRHQSNMVEVIKILVIMVEVSMEYHGLGHHHGHHGQSHHLAE